MQKENPFTISFGGKPKLRIPREVAVNQVVSAFTSESPSTRVFIITGVHGCGKTVLLSYLEDVFNSKEDWVVVELNPNLNLLESLASLLYEKSRAKFHFAQKSFSFSFQGLTFSLKGDKPISNIESLLEELFSSLAKSGKKVLITIDEVTNSSSMRAFTQEFQILVRKHFPVFLLMTSLYENIRSLKNEKSLTFLYRAMPLHLTALNLNNIKTSFQKELSLSEEEAIQFSKLTKGYAFAYQLLGYLAFAANAKKVDEELLHKFDYYLSDFVYQKIYEDLPPRAKDVVKAMSQASDDRTETIRRRLDMKSNIFSYYRDLLLRSGVCEAPSYGHLSFRLPRFKEFVLTQMLFE